MSSDVAEALAAIRRGEIVIVSDNEGRENEGDFIMAADAATPETLGFIIRHSSGIVCAPLTEERRAALSLPMMTDRNTDPKETAFTLSVDAAKGVSTGISAADRAVTLRSLADARLTGDAFSKPGHIFPLLAREGGVLVRDGHTEAGVDLMRMAGRPPVAVICEISRDDGEMMRRPELVRFARRHGMVRITIDALIRHRLTTETLVYESGDFRRHASGAGWTARTYAGSLTPDPVVAWSLGPVKPDGPVRIVHRCATPHLRHLVGCGCDACFARALRVVEGRGGMVIALPAPSNARCAPSSLTSIEAGIAVSVMRAEGLRSVSTALDAYLHAFPRQAGFDVRQLSQKDAASSEAASWQLIA